MKPLEIVSGGVYRHYKDGRLYQVLFVAELIDTIAAGDEPLPRFTYVGDVISRGKK